MYEILLQPNVLFHTIILFINRIAGCVQYFMKNIIVWNNTLGLLPEKRNVITYFPSNFICGYTYTLAGRVIDIRKMSVSMDKDCKSHTHSVIATVLVGIGSQYLWCIVALWTTIQIPKRTFSIELCKNKFLQNGGRMDEEVGFEQNIHDINIVLEIWKSFASF